MVNAYIANSIKYKDVSEGEMLEVKRVEDTLGNNRVSSTNMDKVFCYLYVNGQGSRHLDKFYVNGLNHRFFSSL
jgi:hypothetical protein